MSFFQSNSKSDIAKTTLQCRVEASFRGGCSRCTDTVHRGSFGNLVVYSYCW